MTLEGSDVESIPPLSVGQFDVSTEFDQDLDFFETANETGLVEGRLTLIVIQINIYLLIPSFQYLL